MTPVRVGLIGCGAIAHAHVGEYYRTHPDEVSLIACAEPDDATRHSFSERYDISTAYADPAELLAHADIDVVDICTPPRTHASLIAAAAHAGKHAICEKPLALSYREAADAIDAAARAGTKVGVMQNYRWRPEYAEARATIASGRIGTPFMATVQGLYHWDGSVAYRRTAERMLMIEQSYHYVDLLRFLLGANVARVYAAAGRSAASSIRGETFATLTLHFDNGAIGNIVNSGECQGGTANWGGETVVQGDEGTIYLNYRHLFTLSMYAKSVGGHLEHVYSADQYGSSTNVTFDKPLHAFYQALQAGRDFPVTGADNLNTLATVLAAYESNQAGEVIDVQRFVTKERARTQQ